MFHQLQRDGAFQSAPRSQKPTRSFAARWGSERLLQDGFLALPNVFLRNYARLNLSSSEFVFVLHVMSFKWSESAPFPSYKAIAQRMGITTEMARRHAKSLEEKKLLRRVKRTGQSNAYDLGFLTAAIEAILAAKTHGSKAAA